MSDTLIRTGRLVTIFGGSGFVGRHVVRAVARRGWRIRVAVRRPDLAFHLQPLGAVGQIHAVQANVRYPASVAEAVRGSDAVVDLVGILHEKGRQRFEAVHAAGARAVARAAKEAGTAAFVHMSALSANARSRAAYARSKAHGEAAVAEAFPGAIIIRPSLVFGPEDGFFNRFASLARVSPALPLIGGGETKFQPVFVGDLAEVVARALDGALNAATTYEIGGPEVKSFRAMMEYLCSVIGRKPALVPIPFPAARLLAQATEIADAVSLGLFPHNLLITRDQVEMLRSDNVVSPQAIAEGRTLPGLGIHGAAFEAIVPSYLYRFRKAGQYERSTVA
jgi:NADH dehydrogenase